MQELQDHLPESKRDELFRWLAKIHNLWFHQHGTPMIFLAYNIIDRYLSYRQISADRLQLVGITALHMAYKFENGNEEKLQNLAS